MEYDIYVGYVGALQKRGVLIYEMLYDLYPSFNLRNV